MESQGKFSQSELETSCWAKYQLYWIEYRPSSIPINSCPNLSATGRSKYSGYFVTCSSRAWACHGQPSMSRSQFAKLKLSSNSNDANHIRWANPGVLYQGQQLVAFEILTTCFLHRENPQLNNCPQESIADQNITTWRKQKYYCKHTPHHPTTPTRCW